MRTQFTKHGCFTRKPLLTIGVFVGILLDGDQAFGKTSVAILSQVDNTHAPLAEFSYDAVTIMQ